MKSTKNTLENVEQLIDELKAIKLQHFGEDNEAQEPCLRCIAAPVYDRFGPVIASVSMSFPTIRFDEEKKAHYVELLHNAGRNISKQLEFNGYPSK